ncbi:MAG: poly-gamma-glutamate biosynthesis protein PgsC/CapC [Gammaproteobacteria bacterium]
MAVSELFPLAVFPEGALASSIITTIWVGVFWVTYFNLRFGWVLSGLIVPGYLVPLLLAKPVSAAVVFGEGVLTYLLVWTYSEYLSRLGYWSSLFGRDRFFALVLASVGVRLVCDGWLLPAFGEHLNRTYELHFDYRNNLHSYGLIIVSLIANNFWKTGLVRGLGPIATTTALTYLVVRFGLMELTNFNIGNLGYLYEDVATSILASPKAYILLVVTAFIASRMNLFYGWDFSGILIPSLLALQWYQPFKILTSFVEAMVILALGAAALRLPMFKGVTIEGARKILLFFNVSFAYKLALAYALLWSAPELKITDYYGIGYILPTLIAIKMHDKDILARMSRALLQTSLTAVAWGSLFGFLLTLLPDPWPGRTAGPDARVASAPLARKVGLMDLLREQKLSLYETATTDSVPAPLPLEIERFGTAVRRLLAYAEGGPETDVSEAQALLGELNYSVERIHGDYLYLREREPQRHWGVYVIALQPRAKLSLEVPAPLDEPGALEVGAWLMQSFGAHTLAIAGSRRGINADRSADVLVNPQTLFHAFHMEAARRDVLQVRSYSPEGGRAFEGLRREAQAIDQPQPPSALWIKGGLAPGLDLARLRQGMGRIDVRWGKTPLANLARDSTARGFAELVLNRTDVRAVLTRGPVAGREVPSQIENRTIEGYLQDWLLGDRRRIAPSGSNLYVVPRLEELLYFDGEVLAPIIAAAKHHFRGEAWSAEGKDELKLANAAAAVLGYQVLLYRHRATGENYLILAETDEGPRRRYWGTYVLRLGASRSYLVEAPRPLYEMNSFEYAVSLFESLKARALLIAGAHPDANRDHSADVVQLEFKDSLFTLANEVLVRELGDTPALVVQARAMGSRLDAPLPNEDAVLAFDRGVLDRGHLSPLGRGLLAALERTHLSVAFADGRAETAGYEVGSVPQALYLAAARNKELVMLWLSPVARSSYRQQTEATPQFSQFLALGIPTREGELLELLSGYAPPGPKVNLPPGFRTALRRYFANQDIVVLHAARRRWPTLTWERLVDINSRQGFLLVARGGHLLALVNLTARAADLKAGFPGGPFTRETLDRFVESRSAWLLAKEAG